MDVTQDRIVELAALHVPEDSRFFGGSFSTIVRVDESILDERGEAAAAVHGISKEEIAEGFIFPVAWRMFSDWLEAVLNAAITASNDSDDDDPDSPRIASEPLHVLLVGHNAIRFDFPVLLAECYRNFLKTDCFEQWLFADTLHIFQTGHGCCKLQCLVKDVYAPNELRAHRALDDVLALRRVVESAAQRLGVSLSMLLELFAVSVDMPSTLAQLAVLME